MKRALVWLIAIVLAFAGLLGALIYPVALVVSEDRVLLTRDYGAVFAFSVVGLVAGGIAVLALAGKLPRTGRLPNEWLAFTLFLLALAGGTGALFADGFIVAAPFLALLATAALFVFLGRLVTRWSPERHIGSRGFVLPAVWGAIGAPITAGAVQLTTVLALVFGAVGGVYIAEPALVDNVETWFEQVVESADLSVIETPTVTFAAIGLLGITAPLTEELTKFLGIYILFRNRVATKYGLFIAGAASGMGFAVVETLGYALMTADTWPQIMALRAPVALIHVAATTIVALGWYQHRKHGGRSFIGYFALAVLLHAAWNSMFVSMMIVAAGMDSAETVESAVALVVLALVAGMGTVLIASVLWIVGNARKLAAGVERLSDTSNTPVRSDAHVSLHIGPEPVERYF